MAKERSPEQEKFFEDVYRDHLRKVQFYAMNYIGDNDEAKSVAQDVFLTLWENLDEIDTERHILPYIFVVTKYKCMNVIRKKNYHRKYSNNESLKQSRAAIAYEALGDYTSTVLYSGEITDLVSKSLDEMPDKVKTTYILSRDNHLKNSEIAEKQLISVKTVEYRLNYAFKILRKNLRDYIAFFIFLCGLLNL